MIYPGVIYRLNRQNHKHPQLNHLIIGARQADPSGQSHAGKSYVVFGKKDNTDAIERALTIKSSKPSPLTSPALETKWLLQKLPGSPLMVALLSMASQCVIIVATQSPAQVMLTVMA
jgi:hypothetical protein